MRRGIIFFLLLFVVNESRSQDTVNSFLRLYADNDAFVPSHNATDWGYTSGLRADISYTSTGKESFFGWFNKFAGGNRITTKGWGLMQMIFAPKRTSLTIPDKNDYPYTGALFGIYTIHSANETKKLNLQSEWIAGLMGPPSFGKQMHRFFHRLIKDPPPKGWDYQLPTDILLNFTARAEKLLSGNKVVALLGNAEINAGTMKDAVSAGLRLQAGATSNNFRGLKRKYFADEKPRISFSVEATTGLIFYNALLQGGLFNKNSPVHTNNSLLGTDRQLQHLAASLQFNFLFSMKKLSVFVEQQFRNSKLKDYGGIVSEILHSICH